MPPSTCPTSSTQHSRLCRTVDEHDPIVKHSSSRFLPAETFACKDFNKELGGDPVHKAFEVPGKASGPGG